MARFKDFLAANGYPPNVMWVSPQDVLLTGTKQIFVRVSSQSHNDQHAQADFDRGTKQQFGVLFATRCKVDAVTCCYTWVPRDEEEASRHLMPQDVKFSANAGESALFAEAVQSHFKWIWLKVKLRKHQECKGQLFPASPGEP